MSWRATVTTLWRRIPAIARYSPNTRYCSSIWVKTTRNGTKWTWFAGKYKRIIVLINITGFIANSVFLVPRSASDRSNNSQSIISPEASLSTSRTIFTLTNWWIIVLFVSTFVAYLVILIKSIPCGTSTYRKEAIFKATTSHSFRTSIASSSCNIIVFYICTSIANLIDRVNRISWFATTNAQFIKFI